MIRKITPGFSNFILPAVCFMQTTQNAFLSQIFSFILPPFHRTYYYTIRKKHTLKPIENYIIELHVYVFLTIKCHIKEIAYKHIIANHHSVLLKVRLVCV